MVEVREEECNKRKGEERLTREEVGDGNGMWQATGRAATASQRGGRELEELRHDTHVQRFHHTKELG